MREDEGVNTLENRSCYVFSIRSARLVAIDHTLKNLRLEEDRLALLYSAINHPFLGQHQLFSRQFKSDLHSIDDYPICCLN
jgi:hypothetical protein